MRTAPLFFHRSGIARGLCGLCGIAALSLPLRHACAQVTPTAPAVPLATAPALPPTGVAYRISVGDTLEVSVLGQAELTKTLMVLPEGTVTYPYVGEVKVVGMTLGKLRNLITTRLSRELNGPQVSVNLMSRPARVVTVMGAVNRAGAIGIGDNWRVLDLIAACGGLRTERPEWTTTTLVREGGEERIDVNLARLLASGDLKDNPVLKPGDVLSVLELDASRTHIKVVGKVQKEGTVPAPADGSIISVLAASGNTLPSAALTKAYIQRDGAKVPVDLSVPGADGSEEAGTRLKPGDTLVIPENKLYYAVIGGVANGGSQYYPEKEPLTVVGAITKAGGTVPTAELRKTTLIRTEKDGSKKLIPINLEAMMRSDKIDKKLPSDLPMQPGDVLFVQMKEGHRNGLTLRDALAVVPFVGFMAR